jgi:hypothetical protein
MDGVEVSLTMSDPRLAGDLDLFFQAARLKYDDAT